MSIDRVDRFFVSNGFSCVEVGRRDGMAYDSPARNSAHLEALFDQGRETFSKFSPSLVNVSVAVVPLLGSGEQQGWHLGLVQRSGRLTDLQLCCVART